MNQRIINALKGAGIQEMNPMQTAILDADKGRDLILLSPTGSGKTLAFLLPLIESFKGEDKTTEAMIVAPSRELALQIENVFRSFGSGFRVVCCYGGHPVRTELKSLKHAPTIIIGTPGRLVDHIERGSISLDTIKSIVLDEFDKSLELGFQDEMEEIIKNLPNLERRILTSATEAIEIPHFTGVRRAQRFNFLEQMKTNKALQVHTVMSPERDKVDTLCRLLGEIGNESALVFCNYRESVDRLSMLLKERGVDSECFHGGMEQIDRERALSMFRSGSSIVFVSTDLAARGLDISEVKNVIHYHLPVNQESYTHRNGRTARMNAEGRVFLILHEAEQAPYYLTKIPEEFFLPQTAKQPAQPTWATLTINKGKRDKLSKGDIVGFLFQKGGLGKDELGLVEVKETCSFAAIKRDRFKQVLAAIKEEKIKNIKAKYY